jgi:2OG-Fe(II) oxygenase superfamily
MKLDLNYYTRVYDNFIEPNICDTLVEKYERVWNEEQEKIKKLSLCSGCTLCTCERIDIMQHETFNGYWEFAAHKFNEAIEKYKKDVNLDPVQFPDKFGFEHIKIKRYMPNTEDQFRTHVDVADHDTAKRFLIFIVYLNDNFEHGETTFPVFGDQVKPVKGRLLMFPPTWTYLHRGEKVFGDNPKYILGSYLNYL